MTPTYYCPSHDDEWGSSTEPDCPRCVIEMRQRLKHYEAALREIAETHATSRFALIQIARKALES